jgi:hypothetical protein
VSTSSPTTAEIELGGRRLAIRHLDRVVFPAAGTTKAELLEYYMRVGEVMLAHLRDRLLHMHRYPEGVEGPRFWQKACPEHRPRWVATTPVYSRDKQANIDYCVLDDLAGLLWAVNIGSIELHTSLHTRHDLHRSTRCRRRPAERRRQLRGDQAALTSHRRDARGIVARAGRLEDGEAPAAWQGADRLEPEHRAQVDGLRLLRAREGAALRMLVFEMTDVVERLEHHGDLFAGVLHNEQRLARPCG